MAAINSSYTINITISLGTDFSQLFYLTYPDGTPIDLSTAEFFAVISKHSESVDAVYSTSNNPIWNAIPVSVSVVDEDSGIYSVDIAKEELVGLSEGKYIYSIVARDTTDDTNSKMVSGLAFVDSHPAMFVFGQFPEPPITLPPVTSPTVGGDGTLENLDGIINAVNTDELFLSDLIGR